MPVGEGELELQDFEVKGNDYNDSEMFLSFKEGKCKPTLRTRDLLLGYFTKRNEKHVHKTFVVICIITFHTV